MMRTLRLAASKLVRISLLADATILRFGAVGMFTTTLDVSLFTLIVSITELPVAVANIISYCAGVCVSFLLNRNWTYSAAKSKGSGLRQAARFGTVYAVGATLSTLLVSFLASFIHETVAKLISVPIIFFWHYGATRLWAFQRRPDA
jgi:putative flippase GtrA